MNVLVVTPSRFFTSYGHPVRVLGQVQALARRGIRVCVCSYGHGQDVNTVTVRRIPFTPPTLPPGWHPARAYLDPFLSLAAAAEVLRRKYDLIHAHIFDGAAAALCAQFVAGVPLIADLQDSVSELLEFSGHSKLLVQAARVIERLVVRSADHIVTSSLHLAREIRHRFHLSDAHVTPLLDAVDTHLYDPERWRPLRDQTCAAHNIPKGRTIIAYVGGLSKRQGADTLVALADVVAQRGLPWHFLISGAGEPRYVLSLKSLSLSGHLTYLGPAHYTHEVPRLLGAADIGISPKPPTSEGNGKLLHYMAMGLPAIVFDSEANRELLGGAGIYVRSNEATEWIEALTNLAEEPHMSKALGVRLREHAVKHFSWDVRIEDLLRIYADVQITAQRRRGPVHGDLDV